METMTYEKAIEMGGREWNGKRVYFNDDAQKAALYGVTIGGKSGSINGERISNGNLFKIKNSSPYFDISTGKIVGLVTKFSSCGGYATPSPQFE